MPSCDGSNCGACNCACETQTKYVTQYVHLDKKEKAAYEKRIAALEQELKQEQKLNKKLVKKLLEEKEEEPER